MIGDRNVFAGEHRKNSITYCIPFHFLMITLAAVFLFSGCTGSKKSNFYLLDPLVRFSHPLTNIDDADVSIGIRPVEIPQYLNRSQIVTRSGRYRVDLAEFDRWGETLEESIPRVIAENLSTLLSTDRVMTYPWPRRTPLYELEIEIVQFDGELPGNVELVARWSLMKNGSPTRINRRKITQKKPIAGQGYQGLVSTMSLVLYDMSRMVANEIIMEATVDTPSDVE